MGDEATIDVVVIEDDPRTLRSLVKALSCYPDIAVVGSSPSGEGGLATVAAVEPDLVLLDLELPDGNGIELTGRIRKLPANAEVLILTSFDDEVKVYQAIQAGASGYLLKECLADELVRAIRTVVAGQVYLSPAAARAVVETYVKDAPSSASGRPAALTDREREVLQLVAEGKTTKQIALKLHVSNKAIEATRRRVMDKLGIYSIAELTKYAIRQGLTTINS